MADNTTLIIIVVVVIVCCCCVSSSIAGGMGYTQMNKKDTEKKDTEEESATVVKPASTTKAAATTPAAAATTPAAAAAAATKTLSWNKTPKNKVQGGQEGTRKLYVCQGKHNNEWHPGKTADGFGGCNIGWGGKEIGATEFNYLDSDQTFTWTKTPKNKVEGGKEGTKKFYVCQGKHDNNWHPGRIGEGWPGCNIGWGGREIETKDFNYLSY